MSDQSPSAPGPRLQPSASYSFTMRLHLPQEGGAFAAVAQAIAEAHASSARSTSGGSRPTGSSAT